mmetsp:Transcript_820/g.1044  ORF Transcript_820/g.1044 Transcript_820/m.1044 type:complete len:164 (-) Transcript_820:34-525(-)
MNEDSLNLTEISARQAVPKRSETPKGVGNAFKDLKDFKKILGSKQKSRALHYKNMKEGSLNLLDKHSMVNGEKMFMTTTIAQPNSASFYVSPKNVAASYLSCKEQPGVKSTIRDAWFDYSKSKMVTEDFQSSPAGQINLSELVSNFSHPQTADSKTRNPRQKQ